MDTASQLDFERLVNQAKLAGAAGDWASARTCWVGALEMVSPESPEYGEVRTRIANLDAQLQRQSPPEPDGVNEGVWKRRFYRLGPLGVFLWKFKTIILFAVTKGKILLFGLTKLSTLLSMALSLGVYATVYGWKFALGLILSIYIHEMGHVVQLRKYGIAATAPMFIPGLGALIRLKAYPANAGQDARTGLAGPIWGLGAAVFAWILGLATGLPIFFAIARTGAWINLFNLIPIWQLDGGRGFRALTRKHRGYVLSTALILWAITEESMLLFVALGSLYRLFSKDYPEEPDRQVLLRFVGLTTMLSVLFQLCR